MVRNRIFLLVALVCMAIEMKAQDNAEVITSATLDSVAIKKEAAENYERGNKYWKAKEWDKALTYYEMAAEEGNSEAQYLLGLLCIEGKRVIKDVDKGIEWLSKAGMQGHKDAQFNLASIYYQGKIVPKDPQVAEYWARKYKDLPEQ